MNKADDKIELKMASKSQLFEIQLLINRLEFNPSKHVPPHYIYSGAIGFAPHYLIWGKGDPPLYLMRGKGDPPTIFNVSFGQINVGGA